MKLPREPVWKKFLEKFDEPIIKILLAASLLKIVVDLFEASPLAGGIAFISVLAALVTTRLAKIGDWLPSILFGLALVWVIASVIVGNPSYEGLAVIIAVILATDRVGDDLDVLGATGADDRAEQARRAALLPM